MVDKETPANFGSGVDFNARQEAADLGEEASQKLKPVLPEKMSQAMKPEGMQPWIAEDDLRHAPGCRVFGKDRLNILS